MVKRIEISQGFIYLRRFQSVKCVDALASEVYSIVGHVFDEYKAENQSKDVFELFSNDLDEAVLLC